MAAFCVLAALISIGAYEMRAQETTRKFVPVTDAMLQKPNPGDWLMWRRTLNSWGYSPLDQINRNNVAQLKLVWTRGMAAGGSQESTPLVYDGVMYIPNSGDYIQAVDAKTGDLIWDYQRKLRDNARRSQNRNIAIWGNLIIDTSQTPARTTPSTLSMHRPARLSGTRKFWIPANRQTLVQDRSSRMAKSFQAGSASRARPTKAVSLPPMMRRPARNCGAPAPFQSLASLVMRPGAVYRWISDGTSAHGWFRVSIPNSI
jgi:hypothetical protein